jgi:hypothetical protein
MNTLNFSFTEFPYVRVKKKPVSQEHFLGRQTPGDEFYLDIRRNSVSDIQRCHSQRSSWGTEILQPEVMPGGSALNYTGNEPLASQDRPGAFVKVSFCDPTEVPEEAKKVYGRAIDRIGFGLKVAPGRFSARLMAVEEANKMPPFRDGGGSAIKAVRSLVSRMKVFDFDSEDATKSFIDRWGYSEEIREVIDAGDIFRGSPKRAVLGQMKPGNTIRGSIEAARGLYTRTPTLMAESLPVDTAVNHVAVQTLAVAVTIVILSREFHMMPMLQLRPRNWAMSYSITSDALCSVKRPTDFSGVFGKISKKVSEATALQSRERASFLSTYLCQKKASLATLNYLIKMQSDMEEEEYLAGERKVDSFRLEGESAEISFKPRHAVVDMGKLITKNHLRTAFQRTGGDANEMLRKVPFDIQKPTASALRIYFASSAREHLGAAAYFSRQRSNRLCRDSRLKGDACKYKGPNEDDIANADILIGINMGFHVREIMGFRGVDDVDGQIHKFFGKYADSQELAGEPMHTAVLNQLRRGGCSFLWKWIIASSRRATEITNNLGSDIHTQILGSSVSEVVMRSIKERLKVWSGTLKASTTRREDEVLAEAKRGYLSFVSSSPVYAVPDSSGQMPQPEQQPWDTSSDGEVWGDSLVEAELGLRDSNDVDTQFDEDENSKVYEELKAGDGVSSFVFPEAPLLEVPKGRQAWFSLLVVRQQVSNLMNSTNVNVSGGQISLTLNEKRTMRSLIASVKARKDRLRRLFYAEREERVQSDAKAAEHGKADWKSSRYKQTKESHSLAVAFPSYHPESCHIQLDELESMTSIYGICSWIDDLPPGYFPTSTGMIFAAYVSRVRLIVFEAKLKVDELFSLLSDACQASGEDIYDIDAAESVAQMRKVIPAITIYSNASRNTAIVSAAAAPAAPAEGTLDDLYSLMNETHDEVAQPIASMELRYPVAGLIKSYYSAFPKLKHKIGHNYGDVREVIVDLCSVPLGDYVVASSFEGLEGTDLSESLIMKIRARLA